MQKWTQLLWVDCRAICQRFVRCNCNSLPPWIQCKCFCLCFIVVLLHFLFFVVLYFLFLNGYFVSVRELSLFVATVTLFQPESNVSVSVLLLYFCILYFLFFRWYFVSVRESSLFVATAAQLRPRSNLTKGLAQQW